MILAIDPGVSTGIAWHDTKGYHSTVTKDESDVWALLTGIKWKCVVYETFFTSGRISAPGLQTVRLIGGIVALCRHLDLPTCGQAPQMRYPFQTQSEQMLRGHIVHEKDAMAHLLRYEHDHPES